MDAEDLSGMALPVTAGTKENDIPNVPCSGVSSEDSDATDAR